MFFNHECFELMIKLRDITKGVDMADEYIETSQERQETLTKRHQADMSSDNWLSKSIRPMSLLILLIVVSFIAIMSAFNFHADPVIFGELVLLLGTAFGFYFDSKKRERIAEKNAKANIELAKVNIEIEKQKGKHQMRLERKEAKATFKAKRRAERKQEIE